MIKIWDVIKKYDQFHETSDERWFIVGSVLTKPSWKWTKTLKRDRSVVV